MSTRTIVIAAVVVAGLFAVSVVMPERLAQVKCRVLQRDATSNLRELRQRIQTNLVKGRPAGSFADLAWTPKSHAYDYDISIAFEGHFSVEARAVDLNGDRWRIDEAGTLVNDVDGCAHPP